MKLGDSGAQLEHSTLPYHNDRRTNLWGEAEVI